MLFMLIERFRDSDMLPIYKRVRDQGPRHSSAHDGHIGFVVARQGDVPLCAATDVVHPYGQAQSERLLCGCHERRSDVGFESQARRRSMGQQFTILSAGIPARRAWATAVSAYES